MTGSKRLNVLTESATLAMAKRVRQLISQGRDIVGLTLGEPDFDTPSHIREAAIEAIHAGHTHYPPVAGIPALREAVAKRYQADFRLDFKSENVVVSTGAKQSLINVIMSLVDPGDEAILVAPFWVSYSEMLKMAEANVVTVQTGVEAKYKMTPAQLEAAITPKTRLFLLNNPSNPTGSVYSKAELQALVEVLERHPKVFVISDEIYEYIIYDAVHTCMATFKSISDRVILINGVSKGFAMTGWRIGFAIAPAWIAKLCEKYQGQITSGANSIAQHAALKAISSPLEPTREMRDEFRRRRDFMYGALNAIPGMKNYLPEGAFYFYPDVSEFLGKHAPDGTQMKTIDQLCEFLLEDGGIAVISGSGFGTHQHFRISYAYNMSMLESGMDRIQKSLAKLK